jgi:hypothetical protein
MTDREAGISMKDANGDEWAGVLQGAPAEPEPETTVVFRKFSSQQDGYSVIALFPDEAAHRVNDGMVQSYEHAGQHGAAHYDSIIKRTRPATAGEYANLKRELESAPFSYKLKVVRRRPGRQGGRA